MSRKVFNDGMEVIFQDFNKMGALGEKVLFDRVAYELIQRAENAFFGNSFLVNYASPSSVSVNAGVGFQTDNTQVDPEPIRRMLYRGSAPTLNLTPADLVNDRIDIVVVKAARGDETVEVRKFKNASTSVISNESFTVQDDWEAELLIVAGTPAGSPVAPATPAGYIKIAELLVNAVVGMSGSGDVTDTRTLMPVGAGTTINSSAFFRLTPSAGLTLQQAFEEVDAYLRDGEMRQNDFEDRVTDPAAPPASHVRLYNKGGLLFIRESGGAVTPVGSGSGGGGGADWKGDALEDTEFSQKVFKYAQGDTQQMTLFVKVPSGYLAGRQILLYLGFYSPSAADEWKVQTVASLVRKGQDAVDSVANQHTDDSGDITNDQANEFTEVGFELTSALGQVNGFAVSPGDLLVVVLTRQAPAGTEDTAEIRMIPSTTEVKFG